MTAILTTYKENFILASFDEDGSLYSIEKYDRGDVYPSKENEKVRLGDVYVGRIMRVMKNLQACFVEVKSGINCFLPMSEMTMEEPKMGDEIIVQVIKDGVKTKEPTVSMKVSLKGMGTVIMNDGINRINISKKIADSNKREALKELSSLCKYSVTFRTVSEKLDNDYLADEISSLSKKLDEIYIKGEYSVCHTRLFSEKPGYISDVISLLGSGNISFVTDVKDVYENLLNEFNNAIDLRLYQDNKVSLSMLYKLDSAILELTERKVYLKCGGYLVIDYCEALTAIDVNSGKCEKKNPEYINMEAAKMVAKQIKLRNISGMIIVDFINDKKGEEKLLKVLSQELKKDPLKPTLVDMTKLSLVEITRKKVKEVFKV